mmetsp:Transcript_30742/g.69326  ORF Transcript_30742/g.69326 Transcript_30742/m.69326 type:complete len:146 (-) Transcript_30742:46-483(-)
MYSMDTSTTSLHSPPRAPLTSAVPVLTECDWNDFISDFQDRFDVILGADICYSEDASMALADTIHYSLTSHGKAFLVSPENRSGAKVFVQRMQALGFVHQTEKVDDFYLGNPLANGSDQSYMAHFYRMTTEDFFLHTFWRESAGG